LSFSFFTPPVCLLYDLAWEALRHAGLEANVVNVENEVKLEEIYGHRLPVLVDSSTHQALDWPFDAWTIRQFLSANSV